MDQIIQDKESGATISRLSCEVAPQYGALHDVLLVLDGKKIDKTFFDHIALVAASSVDLVAIDILTCNCGNAGCAGYFDPLIIEAGEEQVIWHCIGECAGHLGAERFIFDKETYLSDIEKLQKLLLSRIEEGVRLPLLMDYEFDENGEEHSVHLDLAETVTQMRENFQSRRYQEYALRLKRHYIDGEPWPDLDDDPDQETF